MGESGIRKRDREFEMPFDPWGNISTELDRSQQRSEAKKAKPGKEPSSEQRDEAFYMKPTSSAEALKIKYATEFDDCEDEESEHPPYMGRSRTGSGSFSKVSDTGIPGDAASPGVRNDKERNGRRKTGDEMDEDVDQEHDGSGSSSTTPPQSSSDAHEQTPRSSNEGDGEKSEKGDSECSKSLHVPNTISSVSFLNFSPSISKRSVTLQMLLTAGILKPGEGTMSLEYHGQKFVGDLLENGQIRSQETSQIFSSPSAWATTCKQIINPDKSLKKSGCGWASIKYKSLKLDYYKAVWFKRLREGSIDVKNISNGGGLSSSDSDDDDAPHCILKFGEHLENNPRNQSAQQLGAKILISCTEFKDIEKLQPFHVKVSAEALALADFHCNITNTEVVGYVSGRWNGDQNTLKMEMIHPCRLLMPTSEAVECDNERNRIALEIQKLGHEVVGWYHSHPKAPPIPSKDDISRQLDYQVLMKGATEATYIPCVGIIISPFCYSEQADLQKSIIQFFWVMPPPENRPLEMGRPMHVNYETFPSCDEFDQKTIQLNMMELTNFYKGHKELVEINELSPAKLERLKESISTWIPVLKSNEEFWSEIQKHMKMPLLPSPPRRLDVTVSGQPQISSKSPSSSTSTSSSPAPEPMDDTREVGMGEEEIHQDQEEKNSIIADKDEHEKMEF